MLTYQSYKKRWDNQLNTQLFTNKTLQPFHFHMGCSVHTLKILYEHLLISATKTISTSEPPKSVSIYIGYKNHTN